MNSTETTTETCQGGWVGCKRPATGPGGMCVGCLEDGCGNGCGLCGRPGGTGWSGYCSEACLDAASEDDAAADEYDDPAGPT